MAFLEKLFRREKAGKGPPSPAEYDGDHEPNNEDEPKATVTFPEIIDGRSPSELARTAQALQELDPILKEMNILLNRLIENRKLGIQNDQEAETYNQLINHAAEAKIAIGEYNQVTARSREQVNDAIVNNLNDFNKEEIEAWIGEQIENPTNNEGRRIDAYLSLIKTIRATVFSHLLEIAKKPDFNEEELGPTFVLLVELMRRASLEITPSAQNLEEIDNLRLFADLVGYQIIQIESGEIEELALELEIIAARQPIIRVINKFIKTQGLQSSLESSDDEALEFLKTHYACDEDFLQAVQAIAGKIGSVFSQSEFETTDLLSSFQADLTKALDKYQQFFSNCL